MKTKIIFILLIFWGLNFIYSNESYKDTYLNLLKENNFEELIKHLKMWEKKEPKNPELYIAFFNYYISKGRKSGIAIEDYPKGNEEKIIIRDPKTNNILGYFNEKSIYNIDDIKNALICINKGISYSKNRLDMYFGKIYILGEINDYKNQSLEIIQLLELSKTNKNNWFWSDNEPINDGENFLLDNIQDYYVSWFNINSNESLESIKNTSIIQIDLYSNNILGYSNISNFYITIKEYKEALKYLLKAEEINSNDIIILNNIAYCYYNLNDKNLSKIYYEKMIQIGTEEEAEFAREMLNKL